MSKRSTSDWICAVPNCDSGQPHQGHGYCQRHYLHWYHHGDPLWESTFKPADRPCSVEDCPNSVGPAGSQDMCGKHYMRTVRWGDPIAPSPAQVALAERRSRTEKPCSTCGIIKPLDEFSYDKRRADGRQARCRVCCRALHWSKRHPEEAKEYRRGRTDHIKRRALLAGVPHEPVRVENVGDDCDWICCFCNGWVDKTLKWPDLMSRSVDHIQPIILGGSDTRDNMRIAHYSCNAAQGTRARMEKARMENECQN